MLRIGLIGAGWHATGDHAPALRHCADDDRFGGQIELTGVCDPDESRATEAASRFGFRGAYKSIETMLPEVDAVISVVPPAALASTLTSILRHRKPVLIEKPLGLDLREARRIERMVEGRPHMVSLNRRFDPGVRIARQWMLRQSPPRTFSATMMRRARREADFTWATGIHLTDLLCFLLGPLKLTDGRWGDVAGANGLRGNVRIAPDSDRVEESVRLEGDGWSAMIETGTHQPWRVLCRRGDAIEVDAAADPATPVFERNGTLDETVTFLGGLLNDKVEGPTVADAMPGTELAAAMQNHETCQ